ncbi:IPT/TIG domain-containing protein [Candidatus Margulisiibacteriota bacterium]
MVKKFLSILTILGIMGGAALAVAVPTASITTPIIASSSAGGNYYYMFAPDQVAGRLRVFRGWSEPTANGIYNECTTSPINLSGAPAAMAVDKNVETLYVSMYGGSPGVAVYKINKSNPDSPSFTLSTTITLGMSNTLNGIALSPDENYLFVADTGSQKIHIIKTVDNSILTSISISSATHLFGLAVKPDGTQLAVTNRDPNNGTVYIFDITEIASPTILTQFGIESNPDMVEPNYLLYSNDSEYLYVKVNQIKTGSNYYDVIIFDSTQYAQKASICLVKANEEDPNNQWDGITITPDDVFLYLTHYRTSIDTTKTTDDGVYGYVVKVRDDQGNHVSGNIYYPDLGQGQGWVAKGPMVYPNGFDSASGAPNGGLIFYVCSEDGHVSVTDKGSPYTDPNGKIINAPPGAPRSLKVEPVKTAAEDLKWEKSTDDGKLTPDLTYIIEYKDGAKAAWQYLNKIEKTSSASLTCDLASKLVYGVNYYLRVKTYDGFDSVKFTDVDGKFGPYSYLGPVTVGIPPSGVDPKVTKVSVKHDPEQTGTKPYVVQNWGYVYDTVMLEGTDLGNKEGYIIVGGVEIPANNSTEKIKIFSWSDTKIEFGIPRQVSEKYIESGANNIVLKTDLGSEISFEFTVNPWIFEAGGLSVTSGAVGSALQVNGVAFGPDKTVCNVILEGPETVNVETKSQRLNDPGDINLQKDMLEIVVPNLQTGDYKLWVNVGDRRIISNKLDFKVTAGAAPTITSVSPNAAPNTGTVDITINGANFDSGATPTISTFNITNVTATSTKITATVELTNQTPGKYDVVVTNTDLQKDTLTNGFTVLDSNGEPSLIIDDFEGDSVDPTTGYSDFTGAGTMTYTFSTNDKYVGSKALEITGYDLSATNYTGYYGTLKNKLDISEYTTVNVFVKSDDSEIDTFIKIQLQDEAGNDYAAVDSKGVQNPQISTKTETAFKKHTIKLSDFVQVDSTTGMPNGGGSLDTTKKIKGYSFVLVGSKNVTGKKIYVDFVAAAGYVPPVNGDKKTLKYNTDIGNKQWLSIPYTNNFKFIQGIADQLNGGAAPGTVIKITRLNPATQKLESRAYSTILKGWITAGAAISPPANVGEGFEIQINADTIVDLVKLGIHDTSFIMTLNKNTDLSLGNKHWISVPYNTPNTTIQGIADEINGGTAPGTVIKIARLNPTTQKVESKVYSTIIQGWIKAGTAIEPPIIKAEAYEIIINGDTTWTPKVK